MPLQRDPRTGQTIRLPYPGEPGYQGPGGGGAGGGGAAYNPTGGLGGNPNIRRPALGGGPVGGGGRARRRTSAAPRPQAQMPMMGGGRIATAQRAGNRPAQAGPSMDDLGNFGALGAVAGIGQQGAVNPASVLNRPRRRGGIV